MQISKLAIDVARGVYTGDAEFFQRDLDSLTADMTDSETTENYAYVVRLARVLQKNYYNVEDWQPLSTLNGVLSQIDNMIAGLPRQRQKLNRTFRIQEANGPF